MTIVNTWFDEGIDFYEAITRINKENQLRSLEIQRLLASSTDLGKVTTMSDTSVPAADPKEDHATPGGQPGDNAPEPTATETTVETPGGTTVTESPVEDPSGD